jgi:hypothetical protein
MAEFPRRNEAKRAGKEIEKEGKIEEIVVQRQSSGKAQFVP